MLGKFDGIDAFVSGHSLLSWRWKFVTPWRINKSWFGSRNCKWILAPIQLTIKSEFSFGTGISRLWVCCFTENRSTIHSRRQREPNDPLFCIVSTVHKVTSQILFELVRVNNPWPNVGCAIVHCYNITILNEMNLYTVLVEMSHALNVLALLIWLYWFAHRTIENVFNANFKTNCPASSRREGISFKWLNALMSKLKGCSRHDDGRRAFEQQQQLLIDRYFIW